MANHDDQPQSWRDRLFGENRVDAVEEAEETSDAEPTVADVEAPSDRVDEPADEPLPAAETPEVPPTAPEADGTHEEQQRAWQAAFDDDDAVATAEYRPSPASAPTPEGEVEPRVVLPSSLRGDNPTGEMETTDGGESPELVEPERPQLSLRRRARAIEDAKEAERAVSSEEDDAPLSELVQSDVSDPETEVVAVVEPEPTAETTTQEPTKVFDAQDLGAQEEAAATEATTVVEEPAEPSATEEFTEQQHVIQFVEEPEEPRKRGARGTGLSVALLSTLVFAGLLGLLIVVWQYLLLTPEEFSWSLLTEVWLTPVVIFSVAAFLVAYLILNLIVNRAGWWAHVLGGFLVAVVVYAAAVLALNFEHNGGWDAGFGQIFTLTREGIREALFSPFAITALVLAREVPIWLGGIVARRGRTQRKRYERELAEHREQYGTAADE